MMDRGDQEKKLPYSEVCKVRKVTKWIVAEAKAEAERQLYEDLETKEGQANIYRIAKVRQRKRQDINQEKF